VQKLKVCAVPRRGQDPQPICRNLSLETVIASKGQVGLFLAPCPNSRDRRHSASVKFDNAALAKADACQRDSLFLGFWVRPTVPAVPVKGQAPRGERASVPGQAVSSPSAAGRTTLPFHPHGPVRPGPWVGLRPLPLCSAENMRFRSNRWPRRSPSAEGKTSPLPSPHGGQHGTGQIRSLSGRDRQDHCRP
jgi:hypothetical protein